MNLHFYIEKLINSEEFRKFKKDNKDAYLCSGFFAIDKKGKDNQQHLDYFVPKINKMFSFKLNQTPIEMMPVENIKFQNNEEFIPEKLRDNITFDFEELEEKLVEKMLEEKIGKSTEKILISIQNKNEKNTAILTVFISNLGLISAVYDLDEMKFTNFEKKSFFDMIRVIKKKE